MLPSNVLRLIVSAALFCTVSSCANLNAVKPEAEKVESTENPIDTAKSTQADTGDGTQTGQKTLLTLPVTPDPMAGELPLALIKDYDQVNSLLQAKNMQQAIILLNQIQQKYPQQSGPSYRLARIFLQQKNYQEALNKADSCLAINPKNYYALNLKGIVLRELGRFNDAKVAYLSALQIYPRYAQSHLNLAILADIYLYDFPLAMEHYENYLALSQVNSEKVNGWLIDLKRRIPE